MVDRMTPQTLIDVAKPRPLTDEEKHQIDFIIERRTGIPSPHYLATLTEAERDELLSDAMVEDRNCLFDQIAASSAHELVGRYDQERRELEREGESYLKPADDGILRHWLQMNVWSPTEALSLWLGSEPRRGVDLGLWAEHNVRLTPKAVEVAQRWELIQRALWVDVLFEPIIPANFVRWASGTGRTLPEAFTAGAAIDTAPPDRPDLEVEAARLREEVAQLTDRLSELNQPHYKCAVKLFGALCVDIYDYKPGKPRNKATQVIANIIEENFNYISSRTVREYIKLAVGELPKSEKKLARLNLDGALSERNSDPA